MTSQNSNVAANPILTGIRRALPNSTLPDAAAGHPRRDEFGVGISAQKIDVVDLVTSFSMELEALTGHVHLPANRSAAADLVQQLALEYAVDSVLSWNPEELPLPGIWDQLTQAGIKMLDSYVPGSGQDRTGVLATLAGAQMGLTGAQAGLADTGSLVLVNGPGRSRLASLLPPVHVALLAVGDLYPTMAHFLAGRPGLVQEGSNVVVVTGPSRTADIELTLTIGVHGPRHLHVILLPDD